MKKIIKFKYEKETKGALRFVEVDKDSNTIEFKESTVGTLYVRKSALNGDTPKELTVTIEG